MLRFLTVGESHGRALVVVVEGLPAGLPVQAADIGEELARRRLGYGRGPRMRFEADEITLVGGIRHGRTLGSPVAIEIANTEWPKWTEEMSPEPGAPSKVLTQPRPGHADLPGMLKYGFDDARDVLERASARETAARVAAGALAKRLLAHLGVTVVSHIVRLGEAAAGSDSPRPGPGDLDKVDSSSVRCFDPAVEEAMIAAVKAAGKDGDSLGGVAEVLAFGVPVGLGSHVHWDRKLDANLARALMSIQAVKAVEIGEGWDNVGRRGSEAHDAILYDEAEGYVRPTSRAGGIEGGISNGALVVVRVAMKPLATLNRPVLQTVDVVTKEPTLSFRERTDTTAVPAMGVVAESMMALVLADEALRKFGGDSLAEVVRNRDGYVAALGTTPSAASGERPSGGFAGNEPVPDDGVDPERDPGPGSETVLEPESFARQRGGMTPRILLVGMMGAGKTTTGQLLAQRLGWTYRDSDADVEADTGLTVPELFARDGEDAFRQAEADVLARACADSAPSVVSVAGGAVLRAETRALLQRSGSVVWLRADPGTLAARVGSGAGRPLLDDDPAGAMVRLSAVRAPFYQEVAHVVIDVDDLDEEDVVGRILAAVELRDRAESLVRALSVDLADRSYPVLIGPGARHEVGRFVPPGAWMAAVVTQQSIIDAGWLGGFDPGVASEVFVVGDGEDAKTMATVESLARRFAASGLSRADVVVAVGGGIVTDVAGFAAATYHRGTAYVNVATSLLAQVDAAIGGKTGVNLPEGKNLVGAFWQPNAVLCDTETLSSLPPREWACGRGEIAKYAFLGDAPSAEQDIEEQVARCVAIKAAVVGEDEREGGRRMILNYGHTLGHALEGAALADHNEWDLRHGEAVAIGLVFAALLAERLGRIDAARVAEHRAVLGSFDLPSELPAGADAEELVTFMARDKKAQQDLTFVLDGPAGVEPVRDVAAADVVATLADMGARR